jgi:hypothetical protein
MYRIGTGLAVQLSWCAQKLRHFLQFNVRSYDVFQRRQGRRAARTISMGL